MDSFATFANICSPFSGGRDFGPSDATKALAQKVADVHLCIARAHMKAGEAMANQLAQNVDALLDAPMAERPAALMALGLATFQRQAEVMKELQESYVSGADGVRRAARKATDDETKEAANAFAPKGKTKK